MSEERYVHRQGIFFQNQKYWCSSLATFVETV
ncbi:Mu transposase C-terminal domain-containing protein [Coprococcus catus]